jgi:hypothetical protein
MLDAAKRVDQGANTSNAALSANGVLPVKTDELAALKTDPATLALLKDCAVAADIPEEEQQEIFDLLLSADIDFTENKGVMEVSGGYVQYRAIQLLGVILRRAGYVVNALEKTNDIYGAIKSFKESNDTETDNLFTSRAVQAMILRKGLELKVQMDTAAKHQVSSNKLSEESPNDAMRIVMLESGYYISGIETRDNKVWILGDLPGLSRTEIETAAKCFGGSNYSLSPSEFPFVYIISTLETLAQNATGPENDALNHVVAMVKERAGDPMKIALSHTITKEERAILYSTLIRMVRKHEGTKMERDALSIVYRELYVKPGLSVEDIRLLNLLATNLGQNGLSAVIDMGDIRNVIANAPEQYRPALEVLHRLSLEISAVADYAEKRKQPFSELVWNTLTEEFKGSATERRVSTAAQQGDIQQLKCTYLKKKDPKDPLKPSLEELRDLQFKLYGDDGKGGLVASLHNSESLKVRRQIIELYSMAMKIEEERKTRNDKTYGEKEYQQIRTAFAKLRDQYPAIVEKYVSNLDSLNSEDPKVIEMEMMRERYSWLVNYFMSDEVDVYVLDVLNDNFSALSTKSKFSVNDPYLSEPANLTLYDAVFREGTDGTSVYSRFKEDGEKWGSTNIAVGEGNKDQSVIMAKQAVVAFVSSLGLTRDKVDVAAPAASVVGNFLMPQWGMAYGFGAPVLRFLPKADIGADSAGKIGSGSFIRDNVQQAASSRSNFNYGLAWQMLVMGSEQDEFQKGVKLLHAFGEVEGDPIALKNMLDAEKVGQIVAFMTNLYSIADGTIEVKEPTQEQTDLKKAMYWKARVEMLKTSPKLKFKLSTDGKKGERTKDEAIAAVIAMQGIIAKYGISVNLEEYYMPVNTGKCTDAERETVLKGLQALRVLIGDAYTLYGAQNKALTVRENKKYEPVLEAMFGNDGEPVQYFVQAHSGSLQGDSISKGFWGNLAAYPVDLWRTGTDFSYKMPLYSIQLGFTQTTSYVADGIELLSIDRELALESFKGGRDSALRTYISFFMWEYIPYYQWKEFGAAVERHDWGKAAAIATITAPFSLDSLHRLSILVGDPIQSGLGLKVMNWDLYIQQQGMTMQTFMRPIRAIYKANHPELQDPEFVSKLMMEKEAKRAQRFAKWFMKKSPKTGEMELSGLGKAREGILSVKEGVANTFDKVGNRVSYEVLGGNSTGKAANALKKASQGTEFVTSDVMAPGAVNKVRDAAIHTFKRVIRGKGASADTVSDVTKAFERTMSAELKANFGEMEEQVLNRYLSRSMDEIGFAAKKSGVQEVSTYQEGFAAKADEMAKAAQKSYAELLKGKIQGLGAPGKGKFVSRFASNQINQELCRENIIADVAKQVERQYPKGGDAAEMKTFMEKRIKLAISNNQEMQQFMQQSCTEASEVRVPDVELAKHKAIADVKAKGVEIKTQVKVEERVAREQQLVHAKEKGKGAKASGKGKGKGKVQGEKYQGAEYDQYALKPQAAIDAEKAAEAGKAVKAAKAAKPTVNLGTLAEAERQANGLAAKLSELIPDVMKTIEAGKPLTRVQASKLINTLMRVDIKDLKVLLNFLVENKGALKFGGKALGFLKILGEVAGPLLVMGGFMMGTAEKWDTLAYGSPEERAKANVELLKENSIGMITSLLSMTAGFVSGINSKVHGKTYMEGYKSTSTGWDTAMEGGLKWADSYLRMGEGFGMMSQGGDWLFDHTVGKEALGGMVAESKFGTWAVNTFF